MANRQSLIGTLVFASVCQYAHATGIDFIASHDGSAERKLVLSRPEQVAEPYRILPADVEELPGFYLSIEPGWDGLGEDRPEANQSALADGAQIALRRVSFDPGFAMFDLDFNPILQNDGDTETLAGEPELDGFVWHEHLVFGVEPDAEIGDEFTATFVLTDEAGVHADSEPFTLTFITASTPATIGGNNDGSGFGICGATGMLALSATFTGLALLKRSKRR